MRSHNEEKKMKRKVILNLALSLDGYISDEQGGYHWIKGHGDLSLDTIKQFRFDEFIKSCDTVVMGRKAYEDNGVDEILSHGHKKILVATKQENISGESVEFVTDPLKHIEVLKQEEGKNIWLFGGALLTDDFIKAQIIDEYILGVIPVILGKGRRLFRSNYPTIELKLMECTVQDGIVIMRYQKRNQETHQGN